MRISWLTPQPILSVPGGGMTSPVASLRYRVILPIRHMSNATRNKTLWLSPDIAPAAVDAMLEADVVVFSKTYAAANEDIARRARDRGAKVVLDICDNRYEDPALGDHYRAMTRLADDVICSTPEMARQAAPFCRRTPFVVEDPCEGPRGSAAFAPGERWNLLWFGHQTNIYSFAAAFGDIVAFSRLHPVELTVLTRLDEAIVGSCQSASAQHGPRLRVDAQEWSLDAQWRRLQACDAVIIPSLQDSIKQVKSANRIVETLWAGRPAVAHPVPSYEAFRDWTPVGSSLLEGLSALAADPSAVADRVRQAQTFIEGRHGPAIIGRQWDQTLAAIATGKPPA